MKTLSFRHPELVEGLVQPSFSGGPDNLLSGCAKRTGGHFKIWPMGFFALALTACSSAVSSDKMSQIKPDMKVDQVTAILGQPTRIEHAETTQSQGDVYYYAAPNGTGRVIFLNSAVFKAEFVPGAKS